MGKFILKRILIAIPVFFGITILVFFLSAKAGGSPIALLTSDPNITAEEVARIEAQLGIDQPIHIQYLQWLGQLLQGNFGYSYRAGVSVWGMIIERLGPTLILTVCATVFSILVAVPLGVLSAYKPYSFWDYLSSMLSFLGASVPNFFAGLLFIFLFTVTWDVFPLGGMFSSSVDRSFGDFLIHLIMPMLTLSIQQIGSILRQTRGSMLEVLNEDYIRTARSKGISELKIVFKHGLRNAFIPVLTVLVNMLPFIIGGAVITEQIFGWPGLGSLMVLSINSRDYPTIMGITVFTATVVLIGNIVADIIYGLLDPKIRQGR